MGSWDASSVGSRIIPSICCCARPVSTCASILQYTCQGRMGELARPGCSLPPTHVCTRLFHTVPRVQQHLKIRPALPEHRMCFIPRLWQRLPQPRFRPGHTRKCLARAVGSTLPYTGHPRTHMDPGSLLRLNAPVLTRTTLLPTCTFLIGHLSRPWHGSSAYHEAKSVEGPRTGTQDFWERRPLVSPMQDFWDTT